MEEKTTTDRTCLEIKEDIMRKVLVVSFVLVTLVLGSAGAYAA